MIPHTMISKIANIPAFSIIIPVYNVALYLRECLDSVLSQTFTDWEALCVDDGSTDGSGDILDEYAAKDKRFRVIHQTNAGVSAARNQGLDYATGTYVWFVDADDILKPKALETFWKIDDKADVTFFSMELIHDDGFCCAYYLKPLPSTEISDSSSSDLYTLITNSLNIDAFGWTWDKVFSRTVIECGAVRFDESIHFFEDELFTLEVFRHAKTFSFLNKVFYQYRILKSGLTRSRQWDYLPIGMKFESESASAHWEGLRQLASMRAVDFFKRAMRQKKGYIAAVKLLQAERRHGILKHTSGRFAKLSHFLALLPMHSIGGRLLWFLYRFVC